MLGSSAVAPQSSHELAQFTWECDWEAEAGADTEVDWVGLDTHMVKNMQRRSQLLTHSHIQERGKGNEGRAMHSVATASAVRCLSLLFG